MTGYDSLPATAAQRDRETSSSGDVTAALYDVMQTLMGDPSSTTGDGVSEGSPWLGFEDSVEHATAFGDADMFAPTPGPSPIPSYGLNRVYICLLLNMMSLLCSLGMIVVYFCQKSRAPRLLLWLFIGNFIFFSAMTTLYLYRIVDGHPLGGLHASTSTAACNIVSSFELFGLVFSMLWPSIICFDLLQSTRDPRWRWEGESKIERIYLAVVSSVAVLAVIGALCVNGGKSGCEVESYDAPGAGDVVPSIISVYLPSAAFVFNVVVLFLVWQTLSRELPFSVRTRRRKQMKNYVFVWLLCWGLWVINSIVNQFFKEMIGPDDRNDLYFGRNVFLYSTGCWNFFLLAVQNAWLKRGLRIGCDWCNLAACCGLGTVENEMLRSPTEKVVKFPSELADRLPRYGSKYYVMRCRLTREEKYALYLERPDLDMSRPLQYESDTVIDDFMAQGMEAQEFGVVRERSEEPAHEASANPHEVKIDVDAASRPAASPEPPPSSSSSSPHGVSAAGGSSVEGPGGRKASDDKMSETSLLSDMGVGHDDSLTAPLMPTGNTSSQSSAEPHRRDGEAGSYDAPGQPVKEKEEEEESLLAQNASSDETGGEAPSST
mmetsp:Transcript_13270/g.31049  ORF Transcript_13270/g.31049 Transcript_13270/m.31049 type:complete len:603 (+) Transcript_13270:307-2115(+)